MLHGTANGGQMLYWYHHWLFLATFVPRYQFDMRPWTIVPMKNAKCLIACPIFKDELDMSVSANSDVSIYLMDHGIHNNAKRMIQELEKGVSVTDRCDISLLVGCECYCDISISQYAKRIHAKYPMEKNCIEIILGPEKTEKLQKDRTTIHTRGWMRMINRAVQDEPLNADSIRTEIGYFDRIHLLDYGIDPITDEEILSYYDLVQVPIEIKQVDLGYFQKVLKRLLG